MPLYDFTCPKCGHKDYNMLVGSDFEYKCKCGTWMKREFPAPNVPPSGKYSFRMDRSDGNATKDEYRSDGNTTKDEYRSDGNTTKDE